METLLQHWKTIPEVRVRTRKSYSTKWLKNWATFEIENGLGLMMTVSVVFIVYSTVIVLTCLTDGKRPKLKDGIVWVSS